LSEDNKDNKNNIIEQPMINAIREQQRTLNQVKTGMSIVKQQQKFLEQSRPITQASKISNLVSPELIQRSMRMQEIANLEKPEFELDRKPLNDFEKISKDLQESVERRRQSEEKYKQDVLGTLKNIEENTGNLNIIIDLIMSNNEKQEEIFEIIMEFLSIAKEKDEDVAKGKYKKVMKDIAGFTGDIETMSKLYGFGTVLYNVLNTKGIL
jgi:hypothetical protein